MCDHEELGFAALCRFRVVDGRDTCNDSVARDESVPSQNGRILGSKGTLPGQRRRLNGSIRPLLIF